MQIKRGQGGASTSARAPHQVQERRTSVLRRLAERFDALMAAVSFAEEGEAETARRILAGPGRGEESLRP